MDYMQRIRDLMSIKKITQNEIAKIIGKTRNTVNNYFSGKTNLDVETLLKISEVLGVKPEVFFKTKNNEYSIDNKNSLVNETIPEFYTKENELLHEIKLLNEIIRSKEKYIKLLEQMNENNKNGNS
jgi:transcriptional regulator with XRE-family HTH domain